MARRKSTPSMAQYAEKWGETRQEWMRDGLCSLCGFGHTSNEHRAWWAENQRQEKQICDIEKFVE